MDNKLLDEKKRQIQKMLPDLRQRYGVSNVWLFGSYVRGEQTPDSDLDILVTFDNVHLSLIEFIQLEQQLSDELGIKVDLVERQGLKPHIGEQILQEALVV